MTPLYYKIPLKRLCLSLVKIGKSGSREAERVKYNKDLRQYPKSDLKS